MKKSHLIPVIASLVLFCGYARAALIITAEEIGSTVSFSWSGSLDTTGVSYTNTNILSASGRVVSQSGLFLGYAPSSSTIDLSAVGVLTPSLLPFGTSSLLSVASSFSGSPFGFDGSGRIGVPASYISNSSIVGGLVFSGASFTSLGISASSTPFVWTLPSSDTVSMTIVPEPSQAILLMLGIFAITLRREASSRTSKIAGELASQLSVVGRAPVE